MLTSHETAVLRAALRHWRMHQSSQPSIHRLAAAEFDELCSRLPGVERWDSSPCDCEFPGRFHSGVPGVLAYVVDGRLADGATVERCDLCERFPSDEAAYERLVELGRI